MTEPDPNPLFAKACRLHCSPEWHLARLKTACAALIYFQALRIAYQSKDYFCSIPQMAGYFDKDERTIAAAFKELEKADFFERLRHTPGKAVNYRPITHEEWARRNPGCCLEHCEMPWAVDVDPLAKQLTAISGGEVQFFFPNVLKSFRKSNFSDEDIADYFRTFINSEAECAIREENILRKEKPWFGVVKRFKEYLISYGQPPSSDEGVPPTSDEGGRVHAM